LYGDAGRFDEAEAIFRDMLKRKQQVYGPDHPALLDTEHQLAWVYLEQRRLAEAEPLLFRGYDEMKARDGSSPARTPKPPPCPRAWGTDPCRESWLAVGTRLN
jgi:tetratricopeptide repeat protein